jgi:hypothetical protein
MDLLNTSVSFDQNVGIVLFWFYDFDVSSFIIVPKQWADVENAGHCHGRNLLRVAKG